MSNKRVAETVAAPHFTRAQLRASNKYSDRKDLIDTLLDDNNVYTTEQVDELIKEYLKGKVV